MTTTTKIFKTNTSQAVRLPKAVAFPPNVSEVSIVSVGVTRIVSPVDQSWDAWFDGAPVTDDFLFDRDQPKTQEREGFDDEVSA